MLCSHNNHKNIHIGFTVYKVLSHIFDTDNHLLRYDTHIRSEEIEVQRYQIAQIHTASKEQRLISTQIF